MFIRSNASVMADVEKVGFYFMKHFSLKKVFVLLGILLSTLVSTQSFAVSWSISPPDVSPATNGHTNSGPVSYYITYTEEAASLEMLDDPGFFELQDAGGNPIEAIILIRAVSATVREVRIEDIGVTAGDEGSYRLHIAAGTAEDGAVPPDNIAIEGYGDFFTVDKTKPVGILSGPFLADLVTNISSVEVGDDAYYLLDFSVDHLSSPENSLTQADEFDVAPFIGVWDDNTYDFIYITNSKINATIRAMRDVLNPDKVIIKLENISGPEVNLILGVESGAAADYADNISLGTVSNNPLRLNDDVGPLISIDSPSPLITHGEPMSFNVNYEDASNVSLSESDITVFSNGTVTADMSVSVLNNIRAVVTFSNFVGEGEIWFRVAAGTATDASGDPANAAGPSPLGQVDIYGPQVEFGDPNPFYTVAGPATIPVTFVGAVSVSLLTTDVIVTTTGTAAYTAMNLVNTGTATRDVVFSGLSGEGTIFISLPAGLAIDQYIQSSLASEDSPEINVGPLPPMSIAIGKPSISATATGPVSYVVTYKGVQAITLSLLDLSVQMSGTATVGTFTITGSGLTRKVTLSNLSGEGAIALIIAPGSAHDGASTPIAGITGKAFAVGTNDDDDDLVPDGQEEFIDFTDKDDPTDYLDSDLDFVPDFVELFYDDTNGLDKNDFLDSDKGGTPDYVEEVRFVSLSSVTNSADESDDQQDSDGDGLPDYLELLLSKSSVIAGVFDAVSEDFPVTDGDEDDDVDNIPNGLEYYLNELFLRADTNDFDDFDRDGYADYSEVLFGLNPELAHPEKDADQDGIADRVEAASGGDLDADDDQDADGIPDYIEYVLDRSRVNAGDSAEIYISNRIAGNPFIDEFSDTDLDGVMDLDELAQGFNPLTNDQPVFQLRLSQEVEGVKQSVCTIDKAAGDVEIQVMLSNFQTNISDVDWSNSSSDILNLANINNKRLVFNPETLATGAYQLQVEVERSQGNDSLISSYTQNLVVSDAVGKLDADLNGLCDSIVPAADLVSERNVAPINNNIMDTDFSHFLRTGQLSALQAEPASLSVSYALVQSAASVFAPSETDIIDSEFGNLMVRAHFQVTNLSEVGASAVITLPFTTTNNATTRSGSVYRLLTPTGWQTFDTSSDQIESASQGCDNSPVFQSGLRTGSLCMRLTIADGGDNDLDGLQNGVVGHLGAPALEGAEPVDPPDPDNPDNPNPYPNFVPGAKQIIVGSAGSLNGIVMMLLGMVLFIRRAFVKNSGVRLLPKFLAVVCAFFILSSSHTSAAIFDSENWKGNPFKKISLPLDKLYLGAGIGMSSLDPDISNIYNNKDDGDTGFKLWLDYEFREHWFVEVEYANLGAAGIEGSAAAIATNVFPAQFSEDVSYQHFSTTALYDYPLPYKTLSVFAKGGLAYANIKSDLNLKVADRLSPTLGGGLQYIIQEKYIARFEYETFSKDSSLMSLGIAMRLGEPKEEEVQAEEVVAPVVAAEEEKVAEVVAEVEQVAGAEQPKSLEQFMEALEPEEPTVNMEELYAKLKRELEPSSLFEKGSASLSNRLMGNLDEIVYFLDTYPKVRVVITGFASDEGHEYLNENLSRLRAHGAKTYLQANGIDEERVIVRARGEHFPKYGANEDDYRIRNRRVEYDFYIPKNK